MDKRFGLIGDPIATSGSPVLFRAAYSGRWPYDLIEGADFEASWRRFLEEYTAINVTAPFKEKAFAQALYLARDGFGSVSGPCLKIGATNLVVKAPDGIQAHNSDFSGIIMSVAEALFPGVVDACLKEYGQRVHIKVHQFVRENLTEVYGYRPEALVVGCGGAGKAAAVAAAEMGYGVSLMNRSPEKAQALAGSLPEYGFLAVPLADFAAAAAECDLVIYTLPCPLDKMPSALPASSEKPKLFVEANYKTPAFSPETLPGWKYVPGREWLLYQALAGYGLMSGAEPDFQAMMQAL